MTVGMVGVATPGWAEDIPGLKVDICDPFVGADYEEDDGDEEEEAKFVHQYDQERSEVIRRAGDVMAALYEETWNLETSATVERHELCQAEPSYVVHWTRMMDRDEAGKPVVAMEGLFSFHKDGTFRYVYAKRPYEGTWTFRDGMMEMNAKWLNGGAPYVVPVEKVTTPVTEEVAEGEEGDGYDEIVYRTGWFRHLRLPTTAKGQIQHCACVNQ
ncbi:hypothetical protein RXV86_18935 [Alisedimentitalea sp. MJ-SS2]|uniref:hypothetical protein n=1 Tax=Aliisedimentitalea sp. MJ-SS2 TaxID=3049795 RepID=UPI002913195B|nr:hypothetical protein [Alisedimentitalea sp. MJ-SS2]MDU8929469.1 hypothetical protein [Alisedimentitalea sp. MJ-SS2]